LLLEPFFERSVERFRIALGDVFSLAREGVNPSDIGAKIRLDLVFALNGFFLPSGAIVCAPDSQSEPKNTTWLKIPTEKGEITCTVSCLRKRPRGDNVYLLSGMPAKNVEQGLAPLLVEPDDNSVCQHVLGVSWKVNERTGEMKFSVRFLTGRIDQNRRLLYADVERELVVVSFGGDEDTGISVTPAGPTPVLSPRR
jgi:hypothetical protein